MKKFFPDRIITVVCDDQWPRQHHNQPTNKLVSPQVVTYRNAAKRLRLHAQDMRSNLIRGRNNFHHRYSNWFRDPIETAVYHSSQYINP